ncbi:MAG: SDR family oxidoreductase [Deltaproteobacteria bacterium]|jgi:NAD(P)-dependent dehydrogenase (short-subunit alcohol dehydrogenase family)|nr:SDR family oxidoreductase [Deltaproteobacteria bacterium]MBW2495668.1 SDR family oxidoreductase [Deltaproteobacteria bacterium]
MNLDLGGKCTIITGGSGGIGRGLVLGFAAEGAPVVIATRDGEKGQQVADAAKDLPGEVLVVPTDVTRKDAVETMVETATKRFGPVEVLVNNAGGVYHPRPFLEKPREEAEWEVNLNIWGVYNCTRAVGRGMVERGRGSIVNITSNSALSPEAADQVAMYGGTKGFVMAFSKGLAYEWGPKGVRINCVAPGWIVPHAKDDVGEGSFWKKYGYDIFGTPEAMAEAAASGEAMFNVSNQPIRRIGRPEDIADLTLFFASERAAHLTGQLVSVSGGSYMP